jgi:ATP-dependent protease ClpP protease subunit
MPKKVLMRHSIAKMQKPDDSGRTVVEVSMYDEIVGSDVWSQYFASEGWASNAKSFERSLHEALDGQDLASVELVCKINSYGGVVDEGIGMFNILRNYSGKVALLKTQCIASAASSASVLFLAGDEREVCLGGEVMIHNASYGWIPFAVTAEDLDALAQGLRRTSARIANMYVERTGIALDEVVAMMDAETYLDANTAIEKGFATCKSGTKAVASVGNADLMKMSAGIKNVSAGIQFAGVEKPAASNKVLSVGHRIALGALNTLGLTLPEALGGEDEPDVQALRTELAQAKERSEASTHQALAFQAAARSAVEQCRELSEKMESISAAHAKALEEKDAAHAAAIEQERTMMTGTLIVEKDKAVRAFALQHHIDMSPKMPAPDNNGGAPRGAAEIYAAQVASITRRN